MQAFDVICLSSTAVAGGGRFEWNIQVRVKPEPVAVQTAPLAIAQAAEPANTTDGAFPVGDKAQAQKLITQVQPVYPAIAKTARIQGTVSLQAIIGTDGAVQNLRMLSASSPLLVQSAMDAVKQWVYQPSMLNWYPVAVSTANMALHHQGAV